MDAQLTQDGPRYTIRFERQLPHPPEKVWRMLTERELLTQWFPSDVVGTWEVGAPLQFVFLHGEGEGLPDEELRGEVLSVEPNRLLEFRWGQSLLRYELTKDGAGCRLLFSESFEDGSVAARDTAGWEFCLANLARVLDGRASVAFELEASRGRFEHYVAKFESIAGPQQEPPETHPAVAAEREDTR